MSDESFALFNPRIEDQPGLPKPPADMVGLLAWLKEMTDEQERLKKIQTQFKATGNSELLSEFTSDIVFVKSDVIEHIPSPCGLWAIPANLPAEIIQRHHDDVKRMFPDAKIYNVSSSDGLSGFAYSGMTTHDMAGAVGLVEKERAIVKAIAEQSEKLAKTKPAADKSDPLEGLQVMPTPAAKNNKTALGIPVKKGFRVV